VKTILKEVKNLNYMFLVPYAQVTRISTGYKLRQIDLLLTKPRTGMCHTTGRTEIHRNFVIKSEERSHMGDGYID
jgi:hypothetical protein